MKFQDWKIQLRIAGTLSRWVCENNETIESAAKKFGINYKKFSCLLRQMAYPSLADLITISKITGKSTDFLLCLSEEKERDSA